MNGFPILKKLFQLFTFDDFYFEDFFLLFKFWYKLINNNSLFLAAATLQLGKS
jgi:hypothetical protein